MCFGSVPSPPPIQPLPKAPSIGSGVKSAKTVRDEESLRKGRRSTILTKPEQLQNYQKTLLGQ